MKFIRLLAISTVGFALLGCAASLDHPRLTPTTRSQDVRFRSTLLNRSMTYRVITPATVLPNQQLPVVWLLHGAGDGYRSWSNNSDIAALADHGIILVMPDAANSYYVNSISGGHSQYEDYLISEVIPDFRVHFPFASKEGARNAIVGISRGGFGAIMLALKHPETFGYAAGISSAIDLAERRFRWRDPLNSIGIRRAFGVQGTASNRASDPFALLTASHGRPPIPYIYLVCGEQEALLEPNRRFASRLKHFAVLSEFHTAPGGHNWKFWNVQLPALEVNLLQHLAVDSNVKAAQL